MYSFSSLPLTRLMRLAQLAQKHAEQHYREHFNMKLAEVYLVGVIGSLGPVALKEVCKAAEIEKSYASRLVDGLLQRGYVRKSPDPDDGRSALLRLTHAGQRLRNALYASASERNAMWFSAVSPNRRDGFVACLDRLEAKGGELLAQDKNAGAGRIEGSDADGTKIKSSAPPENYLIKVPADLARRLHRQLGFALGEELSW